MKELILLNKLVICFNPKFSKGFNDFRFPIVELTPMINLSSEYTFFYDLEFYQYEEAFLTEYPFIHEYEKKESL